MKTSSNNRPVRLVAETVSEVLGPAPLLSLVYLQAGLAEGTRGVLFALLPIACVAILPYVALVLLARQGKVSGRFISKRTQRLPILLAVLVLAVAVVIVLAVARAPGSLIVVTIASTVGLTVVMLVNVFWKLSIHLALATFAAFYQFTLLPALWAVLLLVCGLLALAWSRFVLGAHTVAQILAGVGAGLVVFLVYLVIR
ncbi:hypothetical protein [Lysinibacter sp. HNR]|uniref:hypothetical protein n=1 Tax=Lysinibacter sp. HNR TaxID=3031408 RepID=UPI0024357B92|nr:hypothetical protein [Lysinibacter sp. HNR]WGD37094.1 hypothetical protein FrondiHNR_11735 [Lysinibacter sp. HNR]